MLGQNSQTLHPIHLWTAACPYREGQSGEIDSTVVDSRMREFAWNLGIVKEGRGGYIASTASLVLI